MDYYETLNVVENFMIESGIRDYCTNICGGICCGNCYKSDNACHKNEGRRLTCSIFLCYVDIDECREIRRITSVIENAVYEISKRYDPEFSGQTFHKPPVEQVFKKLRISGNVLKKLKSKRFIDKIKETIKPLYKKENKKRTLSELLYSL